MKAVSYSAHRKSLTWAVVIVASVLAGCVSGRQVELEVRVKELEQIVANKDDDLGYLMRGIAEQQAYIHALEQGAMWQAREMARIRDTCEL